MVVELERRGPIAVVVLQREHRRNAMDGAMTRALDELDDDPALRVGILTGGRQVFSAGTDLAEFDREATRTPRGGEYGIARRERRTPLVAAVEGPAVGGGFEMVLACDLVVASLTATFGLPEVAVGVVASCGGLFRAPRALPLHVANELLLLGDPLTAERAHALGLVNRLAPAGQALETAVELAATIASRAPLAVMHTLAAVRRVTGASDELGWKATEEAVRAVASSDDAVEGRRAFLGRRAPVWGAGGSP